MKPLNCPSDCTSPPTPNSMAPYFFPCMAGIPHGLWSHCLHCSASPCSGDSPTVRDQGLSVCFKPGNNGKVFRTDQPQRPPSWNLLFINKKTKVEEGSQQPGQAAELSGRFHPNSIVPGSYTYLTFLYQPKNLKKKCLSKTGFVKKKKAIYL